MIPRREDFLHRYFATIAMAFLGFFCGFIHYAVDLSASLFHFVYFRDTLLLLLYTTRRTSFALLSFYEYIQHIDANLFGLGKFALKQMCYMC